MCIDARTTNAETGTENVQEIDEPGTAAMTDEEVDNHMGPHAAKPRRTTLTAAKIDAKESRGRSCSAKTAGTEDIVRIQGCQAAKFSSPMR